MSDEKNVDKQKKNAVKQQAETDSRTVIYLGPAIAGVVIPGTVYCNGIPPQLQRAVGERPALGRLLVPVKGVRTTRKNLKNPQSAESICYKAVCEYAEKKGVKENYE